MKGVFERFNLPVGGKEFIGEFFEVAPKHVLTDAEYLEEQRLLREEETKLEF